MEQIDWIREKRLSWYCHVRPISHDRSPRQTLQCAVAVALGEVRGHGESGIEI
jgi:hypothetical protein